MRQYKPTAAPATTVSGMVSAAPARRNHSISASVPSAKAAMPSAHATTHAVVIVAEANCMAPV